MGGDMARHCRRTIGWNEEASVIKHCLTSAPMG